MKPAFDGQLAAQISKQLQQQFAPLNNTFTGTLSPQDMAAINKMSGFQQPRQERLSEKAREANIEAFNEQLALNAKTMGEVFVQNTKDKPIEEQYRAFQQAQEALKNQYANLSEEQLGIALTAFNEQADVFAKADKEAGFFARTGDALSYIPTTATKLGEQLTGLFSPDGSARQWFSEATKEVESWRSDEAKLRALQSAEAMAQAKARGELGFTQFFSNAADNPLETIGQFVESALPTAGSALIGAAAAPVTGGASLALPFVVGGVQGAGSARNEIHDHIMAMPEAQLQQNAQYQTLLAKGLNPEQARAELAGSFAEHGGEVLATGLSSAALSGLGGLGRIGQVGKGVMGSTAGKFASELVTEPTDEVFQQLMANKAIRDVDSTHSLTDGLGEAAAGGLLFGAAGGAVAAADNIYRTPSSESVQQQSDGVVENIVAQGNAEQPQPAVQQTAQPQPQQAIENPQNVANQPIQAEVELQQTANIAPTRPRNVLSGAIDTVDIGENNYQPFQYEIMEVEELSPTQQKAGNQLRDRDRAASQTQVNKIARNLDPRKLADSPTMDMGAPLLAQDGKTVIAGNGRSMALRQAYQEGNAEGYKQYLQANAAKFGLDVNQLAGMEKPVLVRRLNTPVDIKQTAINSNEQGGMRMSNLEQAKVDAQRLPNMASFELGENGEINTVGNQGFITQFIQNQPETLRNELLDSKGNLSQTGVQRLRNAMLFNAYGDTDTLARAVESTDQGARNIINALTRIAPKVAQVKQDIAGGHLSDVDISADIVSAVEKYNQLKSQNRDVGEYLQQQDFVSELTSEAKSVLSIFNENNRSAKRISDVLTSYYNSAETQGNTSQSSMFGDEVFDKTGTLEQAKNADFGERYSLNENRNSLFIRAIEQVINGNVPSGRIPMGTTPDVLKMLGLPDTEIRITGGIIQKVMSEYLGIDKGKNKHIHNLTPETLKQLPQQMNNPVAVFKSSTRKDAYVVLTELMEVDAKTGKNKPIVSALHINMGKGNVEVIDVRSVYGRGDNQLSTAFRDDLLYFNKAKGQQFLKTHPLQLHWDLTSDANLSVHNIKTEADLSQYQSGKNTATPNQIAQDQATLSRILGEKTASHIQVVDSNTQVPTGQNVKKLAANGVEGWFDVSAQKLYIISDNITANEVLSRDERLAWVAFHELSHAGVRIKFGPILTNVLASAGKNVVVKVLARKIQAEYGYTQEVAIEEAMAEIYAAFETGNWAELESRYKVKIHQGYKQGKDSVGDFLTKVANILRRLIGGIVGKDLTQTMTTSQVFDTLRGIQQGVNDIANFEQNQIASDFRYSLNEDSNSDFARAVDTVSQGGKPSKQYVPMGTTPSVLKMLGLPDTKVLINRDVLNKAMQDKHNVAPETLKQLPQQINDPVAVMKSAPQATQQGYVVLTELVENNALTGQAEPVISALHLRNTKDGMEVINIASVYGKNLRGMQNMLNHDLLYWHNEKGSQFVEAFGLQLPSKIASTDVSLGNDIKTEQDLSQYQEENSATRYSRKPQDLSQSAYEQAKSDSKTELTFQQWKQVRSPEFKRWFGDWENDPENASKVINPRTGEPLVVYHGTPNGNFSIFNSESYFSPSEDYATRYQNPSASSISSSPKIADNPTTYAVYLDIKKPFDTRIPEVRAIFERDFFRKWGNGSPLSENGLPDWTDATDLLEFIEENEFDFDGLILDEGADGGYDSEVIKRPLSYVPVNANQIKSATDNNGDFSAENEDIRYSIKQSVADLAKTGKAKSDPTFIGELKAKDYNGFKKRFDKAVGKLDEWIADGLRPVNDWIDDTLKGSGVSDHEAERLKDDMYRAKGVRDALNSELEQAYLKPLLKKVAEVAKANKLDELSAKRLIGYWASTRYAIEKNNELLKREYQAMVEAEKALNDAKAKGEDIESLSTEYRKAERQYRYRKHDVELALNSDEDFKVGTAGGWSNAEAQDIMANIEKHIPRKELEESANFLYDLNQHRLKIDHKAGRYTEEQYNEFKQNRHYVPLTGDPNAEDNFDSISGASQNAVNVSKDRALKGRKLSEAEDGIDASWRAINNSTTYAGWADFKDRIDEIFENTVSALVEKGYSERSAREQATKTLGISKQKMQGLTRSSDDVLIRKVGGVYYEYRLPDNVITALKNDNVEHANAFLKLLSKPTSWYARGVTQWTITFAPMNMLRDTWEKSEFIRVQKLYDKEGNLLDDKTMDKIGRAVLKNAFYNKGTWKATKRMGFNQELRDEGDEKLLKRLLELGGVSTYSTYLARTETDLVKKVKSENSALGKRLEQAGSVLESYNKVFDTVSALAAFKAMLDHGVDEKQAAAKTLELTNFRKTGSKMRGIKALYMFSQPTAMGARNLIKYLATQKGRHRFFGYMAVMMPLYLALRAMDDEDEGGNVMDQLGDITRYIPLPIGDGKYLKIPVGFGMPQMAWNFSVNTVKAIAGDISFTEAGTNMLVHSMKTFAPVSPSEISAAKFPLAKLTLTATPTILQPLMQNVLNRSAFGNQITTNFVVENKLKAEQSKSTTAQFWKDLAVGVNDTFGIDMHPEQIKNLFDGYGAMFGSLRELQTIFIENPNREQLGRRTRTPFLNQFIGTTNEFAVQSRYYEASEEARAFSTRYKSRKERGIMDELSPQDRAMLNWHNLNEKRMGELRAEKGKLTRALREKKINANVYEARIKAYNEKMDKTQRVFLKRWREMQGLNTH